MLKLSMKSVIVAIIRKVLLIKCVLIYWLISNLMDYLSPKKFQPNEAVTSLVGKTSFSLCVCVYVCICRYVCF